MTIESNSCYPLLTFWQTHGYTLRALNELLKDQHGWEKIRLLNTLRPSYHNFFSTHFRSTILEIDLSSLESAFENMELHHDFLNKHNYECGAIFFLALNPIILAEIIKFHKITAPLNKTFFSTFLFNLARSNNGEVLKRVNYQISLLFQLQFSAPEIVMILKNNDNEFDSLSYITDNFRYLRNELGFDNLQISFIGSIFDRNLLALMNDTKTLMQVYNVPTFERFIIARTLNINLIQLILPVWHDLKQAAFSLDFIKFLVMDDHPKLALLCRYLVLIPMPDRSVNYESIFMNNSVSNIPKALKKPYSNNFFANKVVPGNFIDINQLESILRL